MKKVHIAMLVGAIMFIMVPTTTSTPQSILTGRNGALIESDLGTIGRTLQSITNDATLQKTIEENVNIVRGIKQIRSELTVRVEVIKIIQ